MHILRSHSPRGPPDLKECLDLTSQVQPAFTNSHPSTSPPAGQADSQAQVVVQSGVMAKGCHSAPKRLRPKDCYSKASLLMLSAGNLTRSKLTWETARGHVT